MKLSKVMAPYIDAYYDWFVARTITMEQPTFMEFQDKMLDTAMEWGEQSIGRRILHNKGMEFLSIEGEKYYILSIGFYKDKKYACIGFGEDQEKWEIVQYDWPSWLDVT